MEKGIVLFIKRLDIMCPDICPWADTVDISVVFSGYSGFLHQLN
jgi:hypothetical protein